MGKKDMITKAYMKDKNVFADAFNYLLYGGRSVIHPKKLHIIGTELIELPYSAEKKGKAVQQHRDIMMCLSSMQDENQVYVMLGLEAQSQVHYGMPVRAMLYDALQYAGQIRELKEQHQTKQEKRFSREEYLSGLYKTDRLIPVITLIVFFGAEHWDGPVRLHEMLDIHEKGLEKYIQDYQLNLIAPEAMSEQEFTQLHSSLREVLQYIKYSKDKKKLEEIVNRDERFRSLDRTAAEVLNVVTNSKLKFSEEEETVDMCKAIEDIRWDAREAEAKQTAVNLDRMGMSVNQIARALERKEELVFQWLQEMRA